MSFPSAGIHSGVSEKDYHAVGHEQGVLSKTTLWDFYKSPFHWRYGPPFAGSAATTWGSLVDCLLTGGDLAADFAVSPYDSFRTNEAKAWKAEQATSGVEIVKQEDINAAVKAVDMIRSHPLTYDILDQCQYQQSVVANMVGGSTPYLVKTRPDIVPAREGSFGDWIFDLKTISSLDEIDKRIASFGYHAQAGLYRDVWNHVSGEDRQRFGFIFQESKEPFEIAVVELDQEDVAVGSAWYAKALDKWDECQKKQEWPSPWEKEIKVVTRPAWAKKGDSA